MEWNKWEDKKPESGDKVVVVCSDGMSAGLFLVTYGDEVGSSIQMLDAEDGSNTLESYPPFFHGAIWQALPEDTLISFMEETIDDWY